MTDRYGIKISQSGYDVLEEDGENLVFSSEYPTVTIREKKTVAVTTDAGAGGVGSNTYTHGFGYIPQALAFVTTSDLGDNWPGAYVSAPQTWMDFLADGYLYEDFSVYSTANVLTCAAAVYSMEYNIGTEEWDYTYYTKTYNFDVLLLMEEASTS